MHCLLFSVGRQRTRRSAFILATVLTAAAVIVGMLFFAPLGVPRLLHGKESKVRWFNMSDGAGGPPLEDSLLHQQILRGALALPTEPKYTHAQARWIGSCV